MLTKWVDKFTSGNLSPIINFRIKFKDQILCF